MKQYQINTLLTIQLFRGLLEKLRRSKEAQPLWIPILNAVISGSKALLQEIPDDFWEYLSKSQNDLLKNIPKSKRKFFLMLCEAEADMGNMPPTKSFVWSGIDECKERLLGILADLEIVLCDPD